MVVGHGCVKMESKVSFIGLRPLLTDCFAEPSSPLGVVQNLYNHPEGLDPGLNTASICDHIKDCNQFTSVVAKKGDTFLLHGLLPHTASFNRLHYARVITNPHVTLKEEYNLNRPDGDYVSRAVSLIV